MKAKIHPKYHEDAVVTCACGNNFKIGSTEKEIRTELCNMCHPFYTGKQKFVDTARRVEKFQEKLGRVSAIAAVRKGKKAKKAAKTKKADDAVKKEKKEKKSESK
ncbi:MAG: 50S ribosomal protein L31 [Candidatus Magasanikbacteria bacterium]